MIHVDICWKIVSWQSFHDTCRYMLEISFLTKVIFPWKCDQLMYQWMWITRVPQWADPEDSNTWKVLLSKSPPSSAPFVSKSPLFPTPGGGNLFILKVRTAPGSEHYCHNPLGWMPESCQNPWSCPWSPLGDSHWLVRSCVELCWGGLIKSSTLVITFSTICVKQKKLPWRRVISYKEWTPSWLHSDEVLTPSSLRFSLLNVPISREPKHGTSRTRHLKTFKEHGIALLGGYSNYHMRPTEEIFLLQLAQVVLNTRSIPGLWNSSLRWKTVGMPELASWTGNAETYQDQ